MSEMIDLVNIQDEVIGEIDKDIANTNPKYLHRESIVVISNKDGKILLHKRSSSKKVYPNYWIESACGHIAKGETPETAAHRELIEELGFDTKLKFLYKELVKLNQETHFAYVFTGQIPPNTEIQVDNTEIAEFKFVDQNDIDQMLENGELIHSVTYWNLKAFFQKVIAKPKKLL